MEFCAELVFVFIDIVEDRLDVKECLISMGDITTAIGWLHKAQKPAPNNHPQLTLVKTRLQIQMSGLLIDKENLLY